MPTTATPSIATYRTGERPMTNKTKATAPEMERSYLVQRLKAPYSGGGPLAALGEAFSFGGGLKNGGLKDEAMALLRQVFSFDYMGSAEFEFGAVPDALRLIARDARNLTAFEAEIDLATVPPNWRIRDAAPVTGTAPVYLLCRRDQAEGVTSRVRKFAAGATRTKEYVGLDAALRPHDEWGSNVRGWLELDNGFFFFVDREMWSATAKLFGVEVSS